MRRVTLILLGATLALIVLSPAAFSAETTTPAGGTDGNVDSGANDEPAPPKPISEASGSVSQGSVVEGPRLPEETFPPYSQVVDNWSEGFNAPDWKRESSIAGHYGRDYAVARSPKSEAAQYRVRIPASDTYSVYVWLPSQANNTPAARVGVATTSGTKWVDINQKRDGGFWGKIGEFDMQKGESYAIKVAPGAEGRTVADAVAVVRGVLSAPPDERTFQAASGSRPTGKDVVRKARRHLNAKYSWGTCKRTLMSCTCLTKKAFRPFGHKLSMSELKQWKYARNNGKVIKSRAALKPGDLLFFKENGPNGPITHVGVASRNGWLVHSSAYFGRVVEKESKYVNGFYRGVRLKLRG
jgi:cell wall-associated NlpC family hydrolase